MVRTLAELLDHLDDDRGHTRLVFPEAGETLLHRDVPARARGVAEALVRLGVTEGTPVGLLIGTSPQFAPSMFGVWAAGGAITVLPVPPGHASASKVATALAPAIAGLRHLLVGGEYAEIGQELARVRPDLAVVAVSDCAPAPVRPVGLVTRPEAPAIVQFTSGTTARPKAVVLSHRAVLACLTATSGASSIGMDDVVVSWVPLFHDFGLITLVYGLWLGYEHHLFTPWRFVRRPREVLKHVSACRATVFGSPNFGYDRIVASCPDGMLDALDLGSLRLALNGGEPVKPCTVAGLAKALRPSGLVATAMKPVYGMAEAVMSVACPPADVPAKVVWFDRESLAQHSRAVILPGNADNATGLVSVGRAVPGLDLGLRDGHGRELAEGEVGEIVLRGPSLADGYLLPGEHTLTPLLRDGWLHTGDLGVRVGGELYIAGRAKDMVIVAGRNFFAEDVEDVVRTGLPGGSGRCVVVADHDRERMVVIAETDDLAMAGDLSARLRRLVSARLDLGAVDVHVVPRGTLPRTTSGKWQRGLTARYLRHLTKD
ncbi:AMP-binding protein [Streptomyces sp. NPDC056160]|uniref:AMP-binding protein n=1 Tax=Streptomyces sp. NPDC056160 TaxID=3345731 RepID=UPI0035D94CD1